ncbi:IclR family transcriptional regulator [Streptomyces sp. NPDC090106]|uniref:IclR family transcriptional regulator n=1 Tax=Streptomyces sp. NPDC090106 TaxID=3365946 RepID=UPI003809D1CD
MAAEQEIGSAVARTIASSTAAGKALVVLNSFTASCVGYGVSELASRSGLPKSTAFRLLALLVEHGYVLRIGDRYFLADRMFALGNQVGACRPDGLRDRAIPYMVDLHAETRETVHLAILHNTEVLYIEKIFGHTSTACDTSVGGRRPLHSTALGKVLLAYAERDTVAALFSKPLERFTCYTVFEAGRLDAALRRVREDEVATDFEEGQLGLSCIAMPVRDPATGGVIAAMSMTSTTLRGDVRRFSSRLRRVTSALSAHLTPRTAV